MITKKQYRVAVRNGTLEKIRAQEISARISIKYSIPDQLAISFNREDKPERYAEYQAFRAEIKAEVDRDIARLAELCGHKGGYDG